MNIFDRARIASKQFEAEYDALRMRNIVRG